MKLKKFKLKNQLQVLLVESRKSPVVSVQMWVRTGSADEKKGEEGISHFIEHLLFKGTRKFKTGEIASLVEGSGGELNAYTSYDQTVFYVTIASSKSDVALEVISEMMGFPAFDQTEIDNERGVVIEEIKRGEDSLGSVAWKELFSTVFKKHTYKTPIIGFDKNIEEFSSKKIKNYYNTRYVPSNMFLVVTGDFESPEMKKKVDQYFGEFKSYKLDPRKRPKEPPQKTARAQIVKTKFKKTQAYLAWRSPSIHGADVPALDVLSMILGTGDSSRLAKKLRLDSLLAQSVGSMAYTPKDEGVFAFVMTGQPETLPKAMKESLNVALEIMQAPPSEEEMKKALAILSSEDIYSMETVDGLSRKIGSDQFYMKDPQYFKKYLKDIYSLKPHDISKVARKYLKPETLSAVYLSETIPDNFQKEINDLIKQYKKDFEKVKKVQLKNLKFTAKPVRIKASGNEVAKTTVSVRHSGLTLVLRKQTETPTFSLRLSALGGVRAEKADDAGTIELMTRLWTAGSEKYTEDQINQIVESNSAGLAAFGGRNTIGLTLDGLSPSQKDLYDIYFDLLKSPTWDAKILEREKSVQLQQLKHKQDNPAQVCFQQFHQLMFEGHPYSRDTLGTERTLSNATREKMVYYHKSLIQLKNLVLVAVGDFDEELLEKEVQSLEKALSQGSSFKTHFELKHLDTNKEGYIKLEKEQTHIVLGYRGLNIQSEDRFTLDVIQSVLAGQGGRLFLELRDKNSLAYSVSPIRLEGIESGYFGTYIGCSPDKKEKAIEMMRAELKKMTMELISEEELTRAQNYLIGQQAISLQRKSSVSQSILMDVTYGLPANLTFEVIEKYKHITREQVRDLSKALFSGPEVLSIVGL
jgi:zinc protease